MPKFEKGKIEEYFVALGCGDRVRRRLAEMLDDFRATLKVDPEFVFLEDEISDEGNRLFTNLILFTPDMYAEAQINGEENFLFIARILDSVVSVTFNERKNISRGTVSENSRIVLSINLHPTAGFTTLAATGLNCREIIQAFDLYFLPSMAHRR